MNNIVIELLRLKYEGFQFFKKRLSAKFSKNQDITTDAILYDNIGPLGQYPRGSALWLKSAEKHFGGIANNVEFRTVSKDDPRGHEKLKSGGMTGGDRMSHHAYAAFYAKHLQRFLETSDPVIVECGILKGTGLAVWSELFPEATIVGLDIDPSHFLENKKYLESKGAFKFSKPKISQFDQFNINKNELVEILKNRKIDIMIDDGFHSNFTIMNTLDAFWPYLKIGGVYFVEDNDKVVNEIREKYKSEKIYSYGKMTVLEKRS